MFGICGIFVTECISSFCPLLFILGIDGKGSFGGPCVWVGRSSSSSSSASSSSLNTVLSSDSNKMTSADLAPFKGVLEIVLTLERGTSLSKCKRTCLGFSVGEVLCIGLATCGMSIGGSFLGLPRLAFKGSEFVAGPMNTGGGGKSVDAQSLALSLSSSSESSVGLVALLLAYITRSRLLSIV